MFAPHHFGLTDYDYKMISGLLLIAIPFAFVGWIIILSAIERNRNDNDKNDPNIPSPS